MYIARIKLKNVRCFDKLEIDFGKRGSSILVLGDNGDGKSTLLKCLAMGLCDESSASALFRELPGDFIRRQPGEKEAKAGVVARIEIDLNDNDKKIYRIITKIISLKTFEQVKQKLYEIRGGKKIAINQDKFPWESIFVSGYGPGIRVQGTADFQHYLAVDAVYPLFKYDVPLQNPELVIRRLVEAARGIRIDPEIKSLHAEKVLNTVKHLLANFLNLKDDDQILLTPTGIKVKGHWGLSELGELGDGYRATVTWVLDLLAWWFLKAKRKARLQIADIRGIVLFDEIEQHLHPRWQRYILSYFKQSFPEIQLIGTTHSPLVASSIGEIIRKSGIDKVVLLSQKKGHGVVKKELDSMVGWRVDKVLASKAFEYQITGESPELTKVLQEASILAGKGKDRTKEENTRYEVIKHVVGKVIMPDYQTEIEREIEHNLAISTINKIKELEKKIFGERCDKNQSTITTAQKTTKKKKT